MSNLNNEPEKKIPLTDLIKAANTFARLGVDYEVLSDYMQTPRFKKALERVSVIVPEEVPKSPFFYVFETPYFDKDKGEKQIVTFPVDPNSSPESSSLDSYWLGVSKKPSFKVFQQELATVSKTTLNDIPIEVIHLNNVIENIQSTLVSSDFKRDLRVLQNLKKSEAEAFRSSYEQNAEHYRKQTYLAESEREAQHNLKQALETARKIQSQKNNCQSEKHITQLNLDACKLDLANNSTEFKRVLTESETKLQRIEQQLEKKTLEKKAVEKKLNQTQKVVEDIKKLNSLSLEQKNAAIREKDISITQTTQELILLRNERQELELSYIEVSENLSALNRTAVEMRQQVQQCVEEKNHLGNENDKCRMNDQVISTEEDFRKLRDSWDQEILRERLATREFNHQQNLVKFEQLQQKIKQEILNVEAECRQDATTLLNANQKLSKHLQEFTKKLYECERNSPKPRLASEISQLTRFQKGFNQIFGWSVSFLIWPLALHDPDSDLWKLLAETSGVQLRRGPTGIIRGWTCQLMAVGLTVLWWLFLLTLVKQFLWDNRNEKNLKASEMVEDSGKITKWKKLKQIIGRKVSQFLSVSDDGEIVDLTVPSGLRGGSETTQILEYPDFLLFVTIHACKTCNLNGVAPAKSLQVNKYRSSLQSISGTLSRPLGIIAFVFLISSSQLSNLDQHRFLEVTPQIRISNNLTRSLEIYSNQSENQAESRTMRLAQAELEGESRMETQIENPKKNVRRKKFKKRKRMVKEKMKMNFSDRRFKKQKQVKKLSDLPPFENCQTDVLLESSGQSRIPEGIRITSSF